MIADRRCRIYRNTVSGMYTGTLDMFHNTRDQDICTIAYRINLNFFTHQVFIDQDRMILCDLINGINKFYDFIIIEGNMHALSAKYIRRTNKHRITYAVCCHFCFLSRINSITCCSRNIRLLQDFIKKFTVFGCINILCFCTKNRHTHLHQAFRQLDRSLSTELYNCSIRFLDVYNILNIFRCQWFEIQLVCNVKVSGNRLRIVINNNGFISGFGKCPCTMNRTEIELDTLSDTDRTRSKYQHFFLLCCSICLIFTVKTGIIIWCACRKLSSTSINHLERSCDTVLITHIFDVVFVFTC